MMRPYKVNNAEDLALELARLKTLAKDQEAYLGRQFELLQHKVEAPGRLFNHLMGFFPGAGFAKDLLTIPNKSEGQDWVSRIFSVGASALLNRFVLRRAGLFKRLLLTFLSQQAAGTLNKDRVSSMIGQLASMIRPKKKKSNLKKQASPSINDDYTNFGVPPDSEVS